MRRIFLKIISVPLFDNSKSINTFIWFPKNHYFADIKYQIRLLLPSQMKCIIPSKGPQLNLEWDISFVFIHICQYSMLKANLKLESGRKHWLVWYWDMNSEAACYFLWSREVKDEPILFHRQIKNSFKTQDLKSIWISWTVGSQNFL